MMQFVKTKSSRRIIYTNDPEADPGLRRGRLCQQRWREMGK